MKPQDNNIIMRSREVREEETSHCDLKILHHDSSPASLESFGLKLDTTQPWERSLMRSLRDLDLDRTTKAKHPENIVLLRHTESRDQAVDMDFAGDDETIMSASFEMATTPSQQNNTSIYRQDPMAQREKSLLDDSETFSNAGSFKILRGAFLSNTMSSVTSPGCGDDGEQEEGKDHGENINETRGDREERDCGRMPYQRRASDCGPTLSHRAFHTRRKSAPILPASAITEDSQQVLDVGNRMSDRSGDEDVDDDIMCTNSILESERSVSSAGLMGYAFWGFRPFRGILASHAASESIREHLTGMTDDFVDL